MIKRLIYTAIIFLIVFGFNGCSTNIMTSGQKIDKTQKTILISGIGEFPTYLKIAFEKRNWKVTHKYGIQRTVGSIKDGSVDINTNTEYSSKYNLSCYYTEEPGAFYVGETVYKYNCTLLDNHKGTTIVNFKSNGRNYLSEIETTIFSWIDVNIE